MTEDINISFCRHLLSQLRPMLSAKGKHIMRDAWVWSDSRRRHWEFHGPNQFFWHGHANNAYDARYKGWSTWLEKVP
jgi:hypothetical protein